MTTPSTRIPARRGAVLHGIGLHACDPWWRLGPERTQAWNDLDLWLLLDGRGRVETPAGIHPLSPGSCLVLRGGEPYTFHQEPRRRFRHWYAHFSLLDDDGTALPPARHAPRLFRQLESPQLLAQLLERAHATWHAGDPACATWFSAALLEVERGDHDAARPAVAGRPRMLEIADRLRSDPVNAPTVAALARGLDLTPDHFTRLFRAAIGSTPRAFLVAARLERARYLLRDSTLSVRQVAASCGFADPAFFGRHFTSHEGCSPGAWRRKRRGQAK